MFRAIAIVLAAARIAAADDWEAERTGLVVDAALGAGVLHHGPWSLLLSVFTPSDVVARFEVPAAGASLGAGGWLTPHLALTGRVVATTFRDPAAARRGLAAIVGPDLRYWLPPLTGAMTGRPVLWIGGGAGLAVLAGSERATGVGADLRVGYTVGSLQLALEGSESVYDLKFDIVSLLFTVGFQSR